MQSTTDTTAQQHATSIQTGTTTTQHYTQHFKLFLYIKIQSSMLAPPHCQVLALQKTEASSPPHCKGWGCEGASMLDWCRPWGTEVRGHKMRLHSGKGLEGITSGHKVSVVRCQIRCQCDAYSTNSHSNKWNQLCVQVLPTHTGQQWVVSHSQTALKQSCYVRLNNKNKIGTKQSYIGVGTTTHRKIHYAGMIHQWHSLGHWNRAEVIQAPTNYVPTTVTRYQHDTGSTGPYTR